MRCGFCFYSNKVAKTVLIPTEGDCAREQSRKFSLNLQAPLSLCCRFFPLGRTFTILNPTSSAYTFSWVSEEIESLQNPPAFTCLTEKGLILPEKKAEVCVNGDHSTQGFIHPIRLCRAGVLQSMGRVRESSLRVCPSTSVSQVVTVC